MEAIDYAENATDIFVLSDSFIRIKELIDDETSTIDDISEVILLDPALSGSLLKLANSSFFNYPGKIDTISKAVLILGITEVYNLVIAYFTTEAFKKLSTDADFLEDFWERSVDCALLIKFLGGKLRIANAERLFILGLLHNLGELVVKQFLPDKIPLCRIKQATESLVDKQRSVLGFAFSECTFELLKLWRLPFSLMEPIRFQDLDDFTLATPETKLMYIAKRIMIRDIDFENTPIEALVSKELLADMRITDGLLSQAKEFCDLERFSILSILKPNAMMIY